MKWGTRGRAFRLGHRRLSRRQPPSRPSLRLLRLAVPAAATLALCVYALTGNSFLVPASGQDGGLSLTSSSTLPAATATAAATKVPVTSLWFGDSIVEGCCRSRPSSPNMAQMAAATLGWQAPQVQGFPGTGYVRTARVKGVTLPAYGAGISRYLAGARYRVVVIAGGNNDARGGPFSPVVFRAAVRSTLQQVKTALPAAKLVVVGPYSPDGTGYAAQRTIEREEASRVRATFIDSIAQGWLVGQPTLISKDGFSPNDAGQAYLGVRMASELKRLALS
jgi:lysophospholipase L1-like esterase